MNYIDGYVKKVKKIYQYKDRYCVVVDYIAECHISETTLMFKTLEEAEAVKEGYWFLA